MVTANRLKVYISAIFVVGVAAVVFYLSEYATTEYENTSQGGSELNAIEDSSNNSPNSAEQIIELDSTDETVRGSTISDDAGLQELKAWESSASTIIENTSDITAPESYIDILDEIEVDEVTKQNILAEIELSRSKLKSEVDIWALINSTPEEVLRAAESYGEYTAARVAKRYLTQEQMEEFVRLSTAKFGNWNDFESAIRR